MIVQNIGNYPWGILVVGRKWKFRQESKGMNLASPEMANVVAFVALVVSAAVALFHIRDRRNAKYQIVTEYSNQLLAWHGRVVEVLTELRVNPKAIGEGRKPQLLQLLFALIEQGRFYFPNIKHNDHGAEKPPAYRGYRNLALDFLVASYNLHHKPYTERTLKQAEHLQRLFTSIVFEVVRPSERLKEIKTITDRYFCKDLSVEDLERDDQIDAVSHMWDRPVLSEREHR
jgi:hypothetical protein